MKMLGQNTFIIFVLTGDNMIGLEVPFINFDHNVSQSLPHPGLRSSR